jgi:hypothetical protein
MARFLPCDYSQSKLVAVNYLDQLQPGTFEYALHYPARVKVVVA